MGPSQPLGWDGIELIDTVTDPPLRQGGEQGAEYHWDVRISAEERTPRDLLRAGALGQS